jgi:hypothetical protein
MLLSSGTPKIEIFPIAGSASRTAAIVTGVAAGDTAWGLVTPEEMLTHNFELQEAQRIASEPHTLLRRSRH